MDEEPKTNDESWAVEPPKKAASKKRKALRIALIVVATCGVFAILTITYDAYCMVRYNYDVVLANATVSGQLQCPICGERRAIGYAYVGVPPPKPRPFAPKYIVGSYNRKIAELNSWHDCQGREQQRAGQAIDDATRGRAARDLGCLQGSGAGCGGHRRYSPDESGEDITGDNIAREDITGQDIGQEFRRVEQEVSHENPD